MQIGVATRQNVEMIGEGVAASYNLPADENPHNPLNGARRSGLVHRGSMFFEKGAPAYRDRDPADIDPSGSTVDDIENL